MGIDLSKLKTVIGLVKAASDLKQPELVEEQIEGIVAVMDDLHDILGDGFQWSDFAGILGRVVPGLMELASSLSGKSGAEKQEFVVDACWTIYKYYDPNIPLLPEPWETKLERAVVTRVAAAAVEAVYTFGLKRGYWS